ncbi:5'-AMP-activated protein kinase subunit beta-1 [Echinococcus granulosus]|uniref:5'-AMP-activated protein kinase subunit beta-1 n=1 Tax=Echinococcus granulosus TaxID=6210 RepID=W6UNS9_ECHGR|nr:5'-AMP-activated protein kinase subunit beta-1 [Echinococcus granulosus]EUB62918.1 5'-AMP-activated protein kinase subunit beta-1 [Echinococcus granulosus]
MGNTPGTSKRRSSIEEEYTGSVGVMSNPYYPPKRKFILQASQAVNDDDPVVSILTEGHTIEAIANQLRNSRIQDAPERPCVFMDVVGSPESSGDTTDETPSHTTLPTVFKWEGGGKEVYISGTFNGWKSKIPMVKSKQNFYTIIDLPEGEHQYKFIVDGQWKLGKNQVAPTTTSPTGVQNNIITVNMSDFDVIEALTNMDAVPTGSSPPGEYGQVIPSNPLTGLGGPGSGVACAPPHIGASSNTQPTALTTLGVDAKSSKPPLLPPQLLQVILNRDTNAQCDPNLLPQPNHVMLNHMYALSIKDGVIVLSAISRYRQKFVSTVLYKPI